MLFWTPVYLHSSTLIPVCDSVQRPDGQHLEPGTTKEDLNPDTFTDDTDVLLSKSPGDVHRKATGPDLACSQVTPIEPPSVLIPSQVTSLGRDNPKEQPVEPVQSLAPMGTGSPPVPPDPIRPVAPGCPVNPRFPDPGCQPKQSLLRYNPLASHKQCIPEYSPNEFEAHSFSFNDSCSQEMYYSFGSSSEKYFNEPTNSHDCFGLISQGQCHSLSNHIDLKDSEWFPPSSTPVTKMDQDTLNWVGLV